MSFPSVSFSCDTKKLADAFSCADAGVLYVTDLPHVPLEDIRALFDGLHSSGHGEALNAAYTKNKVYKDSFAEGQGGPDVDAKRVLDLSPEVREVT